MLSLLLEPESQVRCLIDALHQQAAAAPVAAEVLPLIPEICAMSGITLDDFTQSRAYQEIFGLGEATVTLRQLARRWRRWQKHCSTSAAQATSALSAWLTAHS